ncbi:MAG: nucleoside kinase [Cellulosilyticaceae bacterium]
MSTQFKLYFKDGHVQEVSSGTTLYEVAQQYQNGFKAPITLAKVGSHFKELYMPVTEDLHDIVFLDLYDKDAMRVYQRTTTFLMIVATKQLFPQAYVRVNHHIAGGYYCEFEDATFDVTAHLGVIEAQMHALVERELTISKDTLPIDEAMKYFKEADMHDKEELFKYRRTSTINVYELEGIKNYFYGYMVPSTKALQIFALRPYENGFILLFPSEVEPTELVRFVPQPKLSEVFRESERWARILGIDMVATLNDTIAQGHLDDLVRVSEALHEKKIAEIADRITSRPETRLVLIAGPSSSGKTTFAHRLCIQLRVSGLKPHVVSIDDYFVNREHTPRDENGGYNFECLEAIDTQLFNQHMNELISGKTVQIPSFNFKSGQREYHGHYVTLGPEDVLVVEGIHGLNEKLSYAVPKENKFKIYVSCLTQLNVDCHNRIPTTDTRLIRRMVRDNEHRGIDPERTLELWPSVRRGEKQNIFPFQEEADVMFNTVLLYELAVLKQKAEPLLFRVSRQSPCFGEAKRLLKFLEYFLAAETTQIPNNSIIREFIGGGCFH